MSKIYEALDGRLRRWIGQIVRLYGRGRLRLPDDAAWPDRRDDDQLDAYRRRHNETSIDGLPAMPTRVM